jgi:hypothetical protein
MPDSDFLAALRALREGGLEFAVVGGLAAVLNGAPVSTFDLDIVPARNEENIARLLAVLDSIDAIYRFQPLRRLKPTSSHLSSPDHHNMISSCGPLDRYRPRFLPHPESSGHATIYIFPSHSHVAEY